MASILIATHGPEHLAVLGTVLGTQHQVRAASSGQLALSAAAGEARPDLILLDSPLPDMSGFAVLEGLQANPATAAIPVIMVTPLDGGGEAARCLQLGAADYIPRPIRPVIVAARVRMQLELKAARDLLRDRDRSLQSEITRRLAENLEIQDVSIRALARLAEVRDPETGGHLRRTQRYIRTLAEELRSHPRFADFLALRNIEVLEKSAPLHDIGKVGIRDEILLKPGRLTAQEREVMKAHSYLGYQAIQQAEQDTDHPIEFLRMAKEITRSHHERWDGSGYPDGLRGDAIPISARLMAVADVFDALITERVYKHAFPVEQAIRVIHEGRGSHFDPDIVDAFARREAEFTAIAHEHARRRAAVGCVQETGQTATAPADQGVARGD